MNVPNVAYRRISEKERDEILGYGFNPPKDRSAEQFRKEIRQICDRLQGRLSESWRYGIGDGDFFIHTSSEEDRMLCVEINNFRVIDSSLLGIAHQAVSEVAEDFCVDFCNDMLNLKVDSDRFHPDFNILVSKTQISIYSECDDLLQRLGIDVEFGS